MNITLGQRDPILAAVCAQDISFSQAIGTTCGQE
jgi:hypothetical protein